MTGGPPVPPTVPPPVPRSGGRRGHRRVVRAATGGPGGADAGASGVGADDRDTGWGDAVAGRSAVSATAVGSSAARRSAADGDGPRGPVSAEDEQYLRDRPPHWG